MGDAQDLGHIEISEGKEEEHSEGGEDDGEESVNTGGSSSNCRCERFNFPSF